MIPLTKIDFITQIVDYENQSQFNLLDKKPIIIVFWKNSYSNNDFLLKSIEQIETIFHNKLQIFTVDVEEELALTYDLGIKKTPTWLMIPNKKKPKKVEGIPLLEELINIIENFLIH